MTRDHAAALALLDVWSASLDPLNPVHARVSAALPELAALYRAVVENWQLYEGNKGKYDFASIEKSEAVVSAALAAVADKLTGEGK